MSAPVRPYLTPDGKLDRTLQLALDQNVEKRIQQLLADPRFADKRNAMGIGTRGNLPNLDRAQRPAIGDTILARRGDQLITGGLGGAMKYQAEAQNANIAAQTLAQAIAHKAGLYRVSAWVAVTAAGGAGATVTVTIGWTDEVGATTTNLINAFSANPSTGRNGQMMLLYSTGAASITAAVTVGGTVGGLQYNVRVACEKVL